MEKRGRNVNALCVRVCVCVCVCVYVCVFVCQGMISYIPLLEAFLSLYWNAIFLVSWHACFISPGTHLRTCMCVFLNMCVRGRINPHSSHIMSVRMFVSYNFQQTATNEHNLSEHPHFSSPTVCHSESRHRWSMEKKMKMKETRQRRWRGASWF